jgi:monoamine oxidase
LINADQPCHFWMPDTQQPVVSVFYVGETPDVDPLVATLAYAFDCNARDLLQEQHHEDWSANPHIGGLYSYDALGCEGARTQLQRPVANRLFFAGEASIEGHFATVDGAIQSGIRAARQATESE